MKIRKKILLILDSTAEIGIRNHQTSKISKCLQTLINFIQYQSDQLKLKKDLGLFIALSIKTLSTSVS